MDEATPTVPDKKSKKELQEILADKMHDILCNNVTVQALRSPATMTNEDVLANRHLYERLGVAYAALGTLNGYTDHPKGFELKEE